MALPNILLPPPSLSVSHRSHHPLLSPPATPPSFNHHQFTNTDQAASINNRHPNPRRHASSRPLQHSHPPLYPCRQPPLHLLRLPPPAPPPIYKVSSRTNILPLCLRMRCRSQPSHCSSTTTETQRSGFGEACRVQDSPRTFAPTR